MSNSRTPAKDAGPNAGSGPVSALPPELAAILERAFEQRAEALRLCSGLPEEQLCRRPAPNRWSLAEVLVHLAMVSAQCLAPLDRAIDQARERQLFSSGPFKLGLIGRFFVWYVEPPPRVRLPAPETIVPILKTSAAEALAGYVRGQQDVLARMHPATGLNLNRARFKSPFGGYIGMDLLTFFTVYVGHERRHLWQMTKIRKEIEDAG